METSWQAVREQLVSNQRTAGEQLESSWQVVMETSWQAVREQLASSYGDQLVGS